MNDIELITMEDPDGMYITPPYPEGEEQLMKERIPSEEEMLSELSIIDPFPSFRVMLSNLLLRVQVRVSDVLL